MASKTLQERQSEYAGLVKVMNLYSDVRLTPEKSQEVQNLQYKVEYRLAELEAQGWDAKIESAKIVIEILKSVK
jgi:hypothetical protein